MEGIMGLIGGGIFYLSWVYQSYLTKKYKKPTFDKTFFLIRIIASLILLFEAVRVESLGFFLVYVGTIIMMIYNLLKFKKPKK